MGASKAKQAEVAERRRQAMSLRIAGADWQTIADRLGYSTRGAACQDVTRALQQARRSQDDTAELLREITVQRYDRLQTAFWSEAMKGDPKAAEVVLKCLAGRARIEGTEAPTRVNVDAEKLGDQIIALVERGMDATGDHDT